MDRPAGCPAAVGFRLAKQRWRVLIVVFSPEFFFPKSNQLLGCSQSKCAQLQANVLTFPIVAEEILNVVHVHLHALHVVHAVERVNLVHAIDRIDALNAVHAIDPVQIVQIHAVDAVHIAQPIDVGESAQIADARHAVQVLQIGRVHVHAVGVVQAGHAVDVHAIQRVHVIHRAHVVEVHAAHVVDVVQAVDAGHSLCEYLLAKVGDMVLWIRLHGLHIAHRRQHNRQWYQKNCWISRR